MRDRARARGALPERRAAATSTRPAGGSRSRSRAPRWSASCAVPAGDGPHPVVAHDPRSGLHQGGVPLHRADLPRPRARDLQRRRARAGRGGVRPADPRRLGRPGPRRSSTRSAAQPDLDRDRLGVWGVSLGGYYSPRVVAALGDRVRGRASRSPAPSTSATAGTGCRSSPATPSGCAPVRRPTRRRAPSRTRSTSRAVAGDDHRAAARRLRQAGPADPLAARRAARAARPGSRAADARGRQPRLRRRLAVAPAAYRRLAGPPSRR